MGVVVYPASTGGGIKSVQRGLATSAGTVTITAVNMSKSFVTCFGTTSNASNSGSLNLTGASSTGNGYVNYNGTLSTSGTGLIAATVQGYLTNSTTLTVSGGCRWEVVEFA
jgi:hypothetical protein